MYVYLWKIFRRMCVVAVISVGCMVDLMSSFLFCIIWFFNQYCTYSFWKCKNRKMCFYFEEENNEAEEKMIFSPCFGKLSFLVQFFGNFGNWNLKSAFLEYLLSDTNVTLPWLRSFRWIYYKSFILGLFIRQVFLLFCLSFRISLPIKQSHGVLIGIDCTVEQFRESSCLKNIESPSMHLVPFII